MKLQIAMPALSDTMSNGRLVRWVKHEGDAIKRGEAIAEVETDKAIMDVEAFHDGYLCGPLAPIDTEIPVGQAIGYLVDTEDEVSVAPAPSNLVTKENAGARPGAPSLRSETPSSVPSVKTPRTAMSGAGASPYARALAQRLGVNLTGTVAGTPIRAADVLAAAQASVSAALKGSPPYRLERNSSFREATAQAMIASVGTPTFRVTAALPLAGLIARAKQDQHSVNLLLARACALSITEHPRFNALYTPDGIAWRERVDIAIAVDSPEGLITPVLRDVAKRSLAELTTDWGALLEKSRTRRVTPADYSGATFYVSDLGGFPGVYSFESIIPQGAAALLSVGAVQGERALCTLNCDHRVIFGGDAARFLETLAKQVVSITASGG